MADLFLDNNVSLESPPLLRQSGHDPVTARGLGMERAGDQRILLMAAQLERTVVTHNKKDFRLLHDAWREWSVAWGVTAHHAGILLLAEISAVPLARELARFLAGAPLLINELYEWRPSTGWTRRV